MSEEWILLANASRARLCSRDGETGRLTELQDFSNPQARMKGAALSSDDAGRAQKGYGAGSRGSTQLDPRTDPRQKTHDAFARELADHLLREIAAGRCRGWVLIASNPFLGELKSQLDEGGQRHLRAALEHDFTSFDGRDLERRVGDALAQSD